MFLSLNKVDPKTTSRALHFYKGKVRQICGSLRNSIFKDVNTVVVKSKRTVPEKC